jgi:hypothetical protein
LTKKIKIIDKSLGTTLKRLQDETQKFE